MTTQEIDPQYQAKPEPSWLPYVGKEVFIQLGNDFVIGVLHEPNVIGNYVRLCPSIVYNPDETARVERETPTTITLDRLQHDVAIRPLNDGDLEKRVEVINNNLKQRRGNIGFKQASK